MDRSPDTKTDAVEGDPCANGPSLPMNPNHPHFKFGRAGFVNDGNMCYMNTAIQVVVHFENSSQVALSRY